MKRRNSLLPAVLIVAAASCGGPHTEVPLQAHLDVPASGESHATHQTPAPVVTGVATSDAALVNTTVAPGPPPKDMVWIPGGTSWMRCESCGMHDALQTRASRSS